MQTQLPRLVYYKDDNFVLELEIVGNVGFLHVECWNWSPSVFKKGLRVFHTLQVEAKEMGLVRLITVSPNPKFCHLFGGTTKTTLTHLEKEYEVVVWDLKP